MGKAFGIVDLIFGLIILLMIGITAALTISSIWVANFAPIVFMLEWLIPGIAIIFGIIGIIVDNSKGIAIAGLILGIIGFTVGFLLRSIITNFFATLFP